MQSYSTRKVKNRRMNQFKTGFLALILLLALIGRVEARKGPEIIQLVFTSDSHFGLKRYSFRGDSNVYSNVVNAAMVAQINSLQTEKLPDDQGVNGANLVGGIDYLLNSGDIANREEPGIQSSEASWNQFTRVYLEGVHLTTNHHKNTKILLLPGNHDISNAIGFTRKMIPLTDNTALVGIYNHMFPKNPRTTSSYQYSKDKVHYSINKGGIHFVFINMWPDSCERIWIEKDLKSVGKKTPILLFAHDQPNIESKHFTNPNGAHTINLTDNFENLLPEVFKDGTKTSDSSKIEQLSFVEFLKVHPNIKAYFNGNDHENKMYDYTGPNNDISLKTFQVDSPIKGNKSAKDETKLSFQLISIDSKKKLLTVRECLWNAIPMNPNSPIQWGMDRTISLK